jgi:hypothetical protein
MPLESTQIKQLSLYDILGVPSTASPEEIKSAYRKLAQTTHPDSTIIEESKILKTIKFRELTEAYRVLKDKNQRTQYDKGGSPISRNANEHPGGGVYNEGQAQESILTARRKEVQLEKYKIALEYYNLCYPLQNNRDIAIELVKSNSLKSLQTMLEKIKTNLSLASEYCDLRFPDMTAEESPLISFAQSYSTEQLTIMVEKIKTNFPLALEFYNLRFPNRRKTINQIDALQLAESRTAEILEEAIERLKKL